MLVLSFLILSFSYSLLFAVPLHCHQISNGYGHQIFSSFERPGICGSGTSNNLLDRYHRDIVLAWLSVMRVDGQLWSDSREVLACVLRAGVMRCNHSARLWISLQKLRILRTAQLSKHRDATTPRGDHRTWTRLRYALNCGPKSDRFDRFQKGQAFPLPQRRSHRDNKGHAADISAILSGL